MSISLNRHTLARPKLQRRSGIEKTAGALDETTLAANAENRGSIAHIGDYATLDNAPLIGVQNGDIPAKEDLVPANCAARPLRDEQKTATFPKTRLCGSALHRSRHEREYVLRY